MDRSEVVSSNVSEIGYDPETETLEVAFKGGSVYQYHDVPSGVHQELMNSVSIGRHLNRFVKGVFRVRNCRNRNNRIFLFLSK
jgi:hypothetical protein